MLTVSVCMVTYTHEKYIREAIEGVLLQEANFSIELIIGNDNSPDSTETIIQEIQKNHPRAERIKYFKHPENIGMMNNFAFVLSHCNGEYIALCDGDDFWTDPLKLQKQVDFLQNHADYALCFHKVNILKKDGTLVDNIYSELPENYEDPETFARLGNYIQTPSVVYRNCVEAIPFEFFKSPIGDYFMHMMVVQHGKLKCLEETMSVYRQDVGFFSQQREINNAFNLVQVYSCFLSYFKDEKLRRIFYERQLKTLASYNDIARYKFTTAKYIATNKSYIEIFKIFIIKLLGKETKS